MVTPSMVTPRASIRVACGPKGCASLVSAQRCHHLQHLPDSINVDDGLETDCGDNRVGRDLEEAIGHDSDNHFVCECRPGFLVTPIER